MKYPDEIALDIEGNIYVSDTDNHTIQYFKKGFDSCTTIAGGIGQGKELNQLN